MKIAVGSILAVVALLLCGCGCGDSQGEESDAGAANGRNSAQVSSSFDIPDRGYPPAGAPAATGILSWDFSDDSQYPYVFEQSVAFQNLTEFPGGGFLGEGHVGNQTMKMEGRGTLVVKSQGDHTARLVLRDVKTTMEIGVGEEDGPGTMTQTSPPVVIEGMREDGSAGACDSSQEMLIRLLFPLPPRALEVGECAVVPLQMPYGAMGSLLMVDGNATITLTGYVDVDGRLCARLCSDIDISDLDVPEEMEGEYDCIVRGYSESYFAVEDQRFVAGDLLLVMIVEMETPFPQFEAEGVEIDLAGTWKMKMTSDNWIRVREAR